MTAASSQDRDAFADLQASSFRSLRDRYLSLDSARSRRLKARAFQLEVWSGVEELGALCTLVLGAPTRRRYSRYSTLTGIRTPVWVAVPKPVVLDVKAVLAEILGPPDLFWKDGVTFDLTWGIGDLRVTFT